jgi:predicted phage terminase large subunit-like protein
MKTINPDPMIKRDFPSFVRKAFQHLHNGESIGRQRYVDYLCYELQRFIDGKVQKLLINLPPRHLKTFLGATCLSAWLLANNPSIKIIIVTCSDSLAQDIAFSVRQIMLSSWYQRIFSTRLHRDRMRVCDFKTTKGGGLYAASAETNITGRGANIIIYDDPLDIRDASNIDQIDRVNKAYDTLIRSRLNNQLTGQLLIIAHRLNEDDLSGHVLEEGDWHHAVLSLVAPRPQQYDLGFDIWQRETGDILRPDAFSKQMIERLRLSTINPDFETFYQQDPTGGTRVRARCEQFKLVSIRDYRAVPVVLSIDPGQGSGQASSYSVIQAWIRVGESDYLLLDQWRDQCRFEDLRSAFWRFVRQFRPAVCLIEATANGPALIDDASRKKWLKVIPIVSDGRSKVARLLARMDIIQGGHIQLPMFALWREFYIAEFIEFPRGRHDDQVDATTQYLDFMTTNPNLVLPPARAMGGFGFGRAPSVIQFPNRLDLQRIGPVTRHYK